MTTQSASYTYHFDGLGSVVALTDATGSVAEKYTYDPFGETAAASALGNPYRYTGRRYDPETGLYYHRSRYYSATLGRFLEVDPIGLAGGMNLYAYVHNNPLRWVDPMGMGARSGNALRPDAYEVSAAIGLGLMGGARARFSGAGEFEGFSLFGGIGAAARVQGAGAAGGSASKQLPGVSEGSPSRFTFGSIFSASLVPTSPVSPTLGFDTELGSGGFVNAQGTGGLAVGPLPVLVCAPCVNVNFTRSESFSLLRALSAPPELSLMAPDLVGAWPGQE